ncbi:MAG: hypothetical protein WBC71_04625 [Salaquimonas sp.]
MSKGPISGEFGQGLDIATKRKALDAEIEALSKGNAGAALKWQSEDKIEGEVTPGQQFEVSNRVCRTYSHVISGAGPTRSVQATACRNQDGLWEPLS